jgi:hypothetical protein|tara:strand:- start:8745 stop:10295 length:1551 start_codon:yes stop_codon:yes gene_type:complete
MNYSKKIDELLLELSSRVGIVNIFDKNQRYEISDILNEMDDPLFKEAIMEVLYEADDSDYSHLGAGVYVKKGDEDREDAKKYRKDDSGAFKPLSDKQYQDIKSKQGDAGEKSASSSSQNQPQGGEGEGGAEEKPQGGALKGKAGANYKNQLPADDPASTQTNASDIEKQKQAKDKQTLQDLGIDTGGMNDTMIEKVAKKERIKKEFISKTLDAMLAQIQQERGAGAYGVEKEDLEALKSFAEGKGPEVPQYEVADEDLSLAYQILEDKTKSMQGITFGQVRGMLQNKGAADPDSVRVGTKENPGPGWGRRDKILKSYLACGGISAVTGRKVSIGGSNVDHRLSLDNGGKDEPENWIWMETNLNMMKSALSDEELIQRVNKELSKSPEEVQQKKLKQQITKLTKAAYKKHWSERFSKGGNGGLTEADLDGMTVPQMKNIIRGWNEQYPKTSEFYVNTYKAQVGGSRGGGRGVALSRGDLKKNFLEQLNRKEQVLSADEVKGLDTSLEEVLNQIKRQE